MSIGACKCEADSDSDRSGSRVGLRAERIGSDRIQSDPIGSNRIQSDPIGSDPESDRSGSDRLTSSVWDPRSSDWPAEAAKADPTALVELDPFGPQEPALTFSAGARKADLAASVDHTLPGDRAPWRQGV